jgi:hypothetical protein
MNEERTLDRSGEAEFKKSKLRRRNGIDQRYYHQTTKKRERNKY